MLQDLLELLTAQQLYHYLFVAVTSSTHVDSHRLQQTVSRQSGASFRVSRCSCREAERRLRDAALRALQACRSGDEARAKGALAILKK